MKNIGNGQEDDSFLYRNKREIAIVQHVPFNGTTTRFINFKIICAQLKVKPDFLLHYLQEKLSVHKIPYNRKRGVAWIEGRVRASTVEVALDSFIKQFIICARCHLPMNDTTISKAIQKCLACGEINDNRGSGSKDEKEKDFETLIASKMEILYDIPGPEAWQLVQECWACSKEETWKKLSRKIEQLLKKVGGCLKLDEKIEQIPKKKAPQSPVSPTTSEPESPVSLIIPLQEFEQSAHVAPARMAPSLMWGEEDDVQMATAMSLSLTPAADRKEEFKSGDLTYQLHPSLPDMEEKVISKGSFWCQSAACGRFNSDFRNAPLLKSRGFSRICCNSCGEEDESGIWQCPNPSCQAFHPLKAVNPKVDREHQCPRCNQLTTDILITYPKHLILDHEFQKVWADLSSRAPKGTAQRALQRDFRLNFGLETKETKKLQVHTPRESLLQHATELFIQQLRAFLTPKAQPPRVLEWNSGVNIHYRNQEGNLICQTMEYCTPHCQDQQQLRPCVHRRTALWLVAHGVCAYSCTNKGRYRTPWPDLQFFLFFHQSKYASFLLWIRTMMRKKNCLLDAQVFAIVRSFLLGNVRFSVKEFIQWSFDVERMVLEHPDVLVR